MTVTWGLGVRRRALASIAVCGLFASLITVLSPPAYGEPPIEECASTNPAWNGDYWKVENSDGTLSEVETNVTGAITLSADGSWTNNNEDPVFRVVLKIDDDEDDDEEDEEVQVLSGIWETGEGGTIDLTLGELDHVTFCSTSEVSEESEPSTTTTSPTTTTTTSPTTTTSAGPTTTTSPVASTATTPASDQPASDETTTNPANPTEVSDSGLASDASPANASVEGADGSETDGGEWLGPEGSLPEADRDTTVAGLVNGGPGEPPALGQAFADPDVIPKLHQWPTPVDLAILGALIAAIAVLINRRRLRRLVWNLGKSWR